ncbi:hypothetical protein FSS13T_04720 [Flavobacterium saliperosum S13]|uniref:Uncharacterized protein n=1 Tax=Flavobacterium saliperosum S13 TaxID=1341155 RepID=A0ABN0QJV0_9FLAO|nr:hypothetical protein FSS13T_04720 [Flavobacterium saliperosum S13]
MKFLVVFFEKLFLLSNYQLITILFTGFYTVFQLKRFRKTRK